MNYSTIKAKRERLGVRNYAIICMLLDSGIRNGELCRLEPEDISFKTGQVKIREGKGRKPRIVLIGGLWTAFAESMASNTVFCIGSLILTYALIVGHVRL